MTDRPREIVSTITIERLAERFQGLSPWTLRAWIRAGLLSSFKIGRRVLLDEAEVAALMARTYRPARRPVEGAASRTANGASASTPPAAPPKKTATPIRRSRAR